MDGCSLVGLVARSRGRRFGGWVMRWLLKWTALIVGASVIWTGLLTLFVCLGTAVLVLVFVGVSALGVGGAGIGCEWLVRRVRRWLVFMSHLRRGKVCAGESSNGRSIRGSRGVGQGG